MTKSSFSRRALSLVAASAVVLSACGGNSPISSPRDAFTINGVSYSNDSLNTLLTDLIKNKQLEPSSNGQASKDDTLSVIRTILRFEAYKAYLKENSLSEDEAVRTSITSEARSSDTFTTLPEYVQELLINLNVAQATIEKFEAYSSAKLKELYNQAPASTGVLCMSHILVKTEKQARAILQELAAGAKFADVAKAKSIEPSAKESGGSLSTTEGESCEDLTLYQAQFDSDFLKAAVAAKAGVPTGPVKTQFGYHIILNHAYDDIKDSLNRVATANPSTSIMVGYLATADISLNPTYGVWNGAMSAIE